MRRLLSEDGVGALWWGTAVECWSAFSRRVREGELARDEENVARSQLDIVAAQWAEVLATSEVRRLAGLLLRRQDLRSADALQLAAALFFFGDSGGEFVTLDERLHHAAATEGLTPIPPLT